MMMFEAKLIRLKRPYERGLIMRIKRLLAGALTAVFVLTSTFTVHADEEYQIRALHMYAHSYAVMDANTGEILFGEKVDKKIYPASTAKLMSAIVAVESGIPLDTMVETKGKIVNRTTPGTYNLGMNGGEAYSLSTLLNMSLIASAADATDTMADAIAGSRDAFAEMMMEKSEELGLTSTSFDNPVGSDTGGGFYETYSTAREMCEITRYAMANETIRKIVRKSSYTISCDGNLNGRQISNTNWFYNRFPYNSDYFTIIGSKTGQTTAAGDVFIATAVDTEGHELICAYFGMGGKEETFRWINNLLTYAFKEYKKGNLDLCKGAYNVRYDKNEEAYARAMTADVLKQSEGRVLDLHYVMTEKQAIGMLEACVSPELSDTRVSTYFNDVVGSELQCTKEMFLEYMDTAVPYLSHQKGVKGAIESASEQLTVADAGAICGAAIRSMPLYMASFPIYEMRTWSEMNPIPFASTMELNIQE